MVFLTTADTLDAILARIPDNTAAMRARCLGWLNSCMRDVIHSPTNWEWLKTTTTALSLTAAAASLPVDFGKLIGAQVTNGTTKYLFTAADEYDLTEAFLALEAGGTTPTGFMLDNNKITFFPTATGTVTLTYDPGMNADYTDGAGATLFPYEFKNLFIRTVTSIYYEYVKDEGVVISLGLDAEELKKMKRLNNARRATPKINTSGYIRGDY